MSIATRRSKQQTNALRNSVMSAVLAAASMGVTTSALATVITTKLNGGITVHDSGFVFIPGAQRYSIRADVVFDNASKASDTTLTEPKLTNTTTATQILYGPLPGPPFGYADIDHTGTVGFLRITVDYTLTPHAQAGTPPPRPRTTKTTATYFDSVSSLSGTTASTTDVTPVIKAGTQVQGQSLQFDARFAEFEIGDPASVWLDDSSTPAGVFDLYRILIFENALGKIEASVTLFDSLTSDFAFSYDASADMIKFAIESADWMRDSDGFLALGNDLSLLTAMVTTLNPARDGTPVALADRSIATAFDIHDINVIANPSTLSLFAVAALALIGNTMTKRTRHRRD